MRKRSLVPSAAAVEATRIMSERHVQDNIIREAKGLGFLVYHPWISVKSYPGYPDLTLVRPEGQRAGRAILVECKSEAGVVSREQREWLLAWATVYGVEAYVVRPSTIEAMYRVLIGSTTESDRGELKL